MLCNLPCRIVLIAVNTATGLLGLAILVVGALMVWGKSMATSLLDRLLTPLLSKFGTSHDAPQVTALISRLLSSTAPIGMTLVSIGAALLILSFIGYCGSCCNYKVLLYLYAIIIGLVALVILVAVIAYFSMKHKVAMYAVELYAKHVRGYVSMQENNVDSLVVGLIQGWLHCCGVDSAADFGNMSITDIYNRVHYNSMVLPVPCCKVNQNFELDETYCPPTPTDENSYRNYPCRASIRNAFVHYTKFIAYGLIGTFIVLLILLLFTLLTIRVDFI